MNDLVPQGASWQFRSFEVLDWADLFPPGLLPSLSELLRKGAEATGQGACFVSLNCIFLDFSVACVQVKHFFEGCSKKHVSVSPHPRVPSISLPQRHLLFPVSVCPSRGDLQKCTDTNMNIFLEGPGMGPLRLLYLLDNMAYTIPKARHPSPSTRETAAQSRLGSLPHAPRPGLLNTVQAVRIDSLHAVTAQTPKWMCRLTVVWCP